MNHFERRVSEQSDDDLRCLELATLVVSVTKRCNQTCSHCHVSSSPRRSEMMGADVMGAVASIASSQRPTIIDITGGAPELNSHLPDLLGTLRSDAHRVQLRTNLTILEYPEFEHFSALYASLGIELLASMPCYTERNVKVIRGDGVRDASVRVLRRLNELGYGAEGGLRLDLIYNPVGTMLPEPQEELEELFRAELGERFDIVFTRLLTMTNMPVGRFRDQLIATGTYDRYLTALEQAFNPDSLPLLQCRHLIEVGWDGTLFDCDFNLGDGRPVAHDAPKTIWDFDAQALATRRIVHSKHCFACTAGRGSS